MARFCLGCYPTHVPVLTSSVHIMRSDAYLELGKSRFTSSRVLAVWGEDRDFRIAKCVSPQLTIVKNPGKTARPC